LSGFLVACSSQPAPAEHPLTAAVLPIPQATERAKGGAEPAPTSVDLPPAPGGLVLDGSTEEWPAPIIAAEHERIWLAADRRGLALAIELDPGATATPALTLRHPAAALPPIGFVNQFGSVDVDGEGWCETELDVGRAGTADELQARDTCKRWYKEQFARRGQLLGAFEATMPLDPVASPGVRAASRRAAGRPIVEAQVDLQALPALTTVDWREIEIEIAVPGSVTHRFAAHLGEPVRVVKPGTLLDRVLTGPAVAPGEVAAYYRASDLETVHFLLNEARGYQWTPGAESPSDIVVDLSARSRVVSLGDVSIESVVVAPGFGWHGGEALVSLRGDQVIDLVSISGGRVEGTARRNDKTDIVIVREGTASLLGTGACGGCPTIEVAFSTVTDDGRFTPLASLVEAGGYGEDLVGHSIAADLSSIVVRYNHTDYGDRPRTEGVEIKLSYDRRTRSYRDARRTTKAFPQP
jgi:hypothetical protein